ncbi:MAG: HEAT repeat domain-containing protein [Deltaproteobacteria bacterium]|nr:HEAT repeat domain-containing protein [Deltaproteobacteria bacterium]
MRRLPLLLGAVLLVPVLCRASSVEPNDVRISDPGTLSRALATTGMSSDLVRLAGRVDTALLVAALQDGDPALARGVLSLMPHVKGPAVFLPVLVDLSASRDRDLASRAARAAVLVASKIDVRSGEGCVDAQCDLVELGEHMHEALEKVLATPGIGPDIRRDMLALLATDTGRGYAGALDAELVDLLGDADPRVRTAAATLMTPPADEDQLEALLDAAGDEDDPAVASTCLLAACAAMGLEEGRKHERTFEKSLARLVEELEPTARVLAPVASCLQGLGTPWAGEQVEKLTVGATP